MLNRLTSLFAFAALLVLNPALAQKKVNYQLSFPNAVHHEAQISVTFTGITSDTLAVLMSRSSPGRYALHEFSKNVYGVRATDAQGKQLSIKKSNLHQWNVTGHKGSVTVTYTLFGNHADGTYAGIDETHAHLNMPATLMYAKGFEEVPAQVTFNMPQGSNWKVATQLKPESGTTYSAPNFQYLMDSPTELSNFDLEEWTVNENGKTKTIQVTLHHNASKELFREYAAQAKKIVAEQRAIFEELPDFDFGRYTFIGCYMPQAVGDGMEHRNSTIVTSSRPLAANMEGVLGTVSHEFFHSWNVERIRPQGLEPFNFQEANMTEGLWLAEGFTSYYGPLAMQRSGITSLQNYARGLAGGLNYVLLSPGRQYHSLVEMSMQAPYVDAARSVDAVNRHNTFISYYTYGSVVGLALDLTLRRDYKTTLDKYMQALWRKYGKPEKPYSMADLEETLGEVSGNKAWAASFFKNSVHGSELPDFAPLLAQAGLVLRKANPGKPSLGTAYFEYAKDSTGATLLNGAVIGSPIYKAGLEGGDVLLTLDGKKLTDTKTFDAILAAHKPGETIPVTFERYGETRNASIVLEENPNLEVVLFEDAGQKVTSKVKKFREEWLGAKVK
ncbi:M61 family metallopeptidase [Pontibacter sp. SGAir0037]|uniref:M61 family metallopeptidase n=1 Tax=Pontibacter sp. SGAir0037 TaxID=2571030 RepID=UPI0010CD3567|nr:PDZ domain-containing protein [Pontibacter sp. SGAir0037]QCR23245.1 peptidase M61 [Pontibacter sp. SGAir0037]